MLKVRYVPQNSTENDYINSRLLPSAMLLSCIIEFQNLSTYLYGSLSFDAFDAG